MSEPRDPDETQPVQPEGDQHWPSYEPPAEPRAEPAAGPDADAAWPRPWPSAALPPSSFPPPRHHQQPPPPPGAYTPGAYYQPHPGLLGYQQQHGGAATSMTLGIISLVAVAVSPLLCCVTLPAALTGPFGIALGARALRAIDAEPGRYANRSQATTGILTGAIGTALGLVMLVLLLFVFSAGSLYGD
ncbi:DUF4190 domain-containing protein [Nocardioides nanhaiensis]|uniref:DUF4190 domain-containing protein n=1 Tax=Nocardioides nanhaiensis TaxID=1476871 RepID=A0ABP8W896_9ACTN